MATHHANPCEIIDLDTWTKDLPHEQSKAIIKTNEMELARLVISAGKEFQRHKVSGPIIVYCIKGRIVFDAMGTTQELTAGQLLHLMPGEPHTVKAVKDSVVLLTIIFKQPELRIPVTPASILQEEHKYILKVVDACKQISESLEKGNEIDSKFLLEIAEFMREFADKCHHGKEEDILFPAMEKAGIPTGGCPLQALRHDHVLGRKYVTALTEAAEKYANNKSTSVNDVIAALNNIHSLYPSHIWKEDEMAFPMEKRFFSEEELNELVNQFEQVEQKIGKDVHKKYKKFADDLLNRAQGTLQRAHVGCHCC